VVLAAVKHSCWALEFADDSLKADREFMLEAVKQTGFTLHYASEDLQQDKELQKIAEETGG
jgi:tRNA(Phe) wybutosine-synthesizing methylase Tyw3